MSTPPNTILTREQARAILAAKGLLVDFNFEIADDFVPLDAETLLAHGTLPENAPSSLDLINEDRGDLVPIIPIHISEK